MKKAKIISGLDVELPIATLDNFSNFEEKISKIKCIRAVKDNLDETFLIDVIDELELKGKKISSKKLKKVFKKVLIKMIEEVEI